MKHFCKKIAATVAMAIMLLMVAAPAFAGYDLKKSIARFSAVAGEALVTGDVVCLKDADGLAYEADGNDAALRPAVGIVGKGGAIGDNVEIVVVGIFSGWTTLSEGAYTYLSETAGAVTQVAPTYAQICGKAISTTDYFFNFSNYMDTSALVAIGTLTGATPIILEGATADAFETTIAPTDPTADRTVTLADAAGTVMLSSLATNGADAANAVTGASNGLVFEGATADAFETTLAPTDPTADRTITFPDRSGTAVLETITITAKVETDSPVTVTTASAGQAFTNAAAGAAVVFNLPEASTWIGQRITFAVLAAQNLDINPDNADLIIGLTNAAGDAARNATVGGTITLMAVDAVNIVVISSYGTWSDVN